MLPKMQKSHFVKKYSVQFVNSSGRQSAPFYFWDNKPHECSQTWQVVRSEFDLLMLNNAREQGVDAQEGARVLEVLFEGERAVGVKVRDQQNNDREVFAKVVVDASGQTAMLQNRFKLRLWDPVLNKGAIWTYWEGAYRDTGRDEGATLVVQTADKQGWFWYILLHGDIVSVGVVSGFDHLFKGRESHEKTGEEEVERSLPSRSAEMAKRVTGYFVTKTTRTDRSRWPATAGCWSAMRSAFSIRCTRRACCSRSSPASSPPTRSRKDWRAATRQPLNSASGARISTRASIGCGAWCASTTPGSASASSSGTIRTFAGPLPIC